MRPLPAHPFVYQVNARVHLAALARTRGRPVTLADVGDDQLDTWAGWGVDVLYLLGVWPTGAAARAVSLGDVAALAAHRRTLPDLTLADVTGSPFAVAAYTVDRRLGGPDALAGLRARLAERGIRLLLDVVPNHTAPDHHWVREHPERYVAGTLDDLLADPATWTVVGTGAGDRVLAHGRDPNYPAWPDTLQLDHAHPEVGPALEATLLSIADQCDGVRCDMAMLLEPDVVARTWGRTAPPFWPSAIARVRAAHPGFVFVAEVYWGLEERLQRHGFDATYDKDLYDRLRAGDAPGVRRHLGAPPAVQARAVRFVENHDEDRAAAAFPPERLRAATLVAWASGGWRFAHEGQLDGARTHVSMHLGRAPEEPVDADLRGFGERLLAALRRPELRDGAVEPAPVTPAWPGNPTHEGFVALWWTGGGRHALAVANLGPTTGQCFVGLAPAAGWRDRTVTLGDLLGDTAFERPGSDLAERGLYLDLPTGGHHLFTVAV